VGIVYKASDPTIDREVALKFFPQSFSGGRVQQPAANVHARSPGGRRLSHPSIVTIHDAFDDKETQTSCIVMELVPVRPGEILESATP